MKGEVVILISIFILITATINVRHAVSVPNSEIKSTFGYLGWELFFMINSTAEVNVEETIIVKAWFTPDDDIDEVQIYLSISGAGISYERSWVGIKLSPSQVITDTASLNPTIEGEVRCQIEAFYLDVPYGDYEYGIINTTITIVRNTTYSELYENYIDLNETYQQLSESYTNLNNAYNQLNESYTNLNNTYQQLSNDYINLNGTYNQLHDSYIDLNETYQQLSESYTNLNNAYNQAVQINKEKEEQLNFYKTLSYITLPIAVITIVLLVTIGAYHKLKKRERQSAN